MTARRLGMTIRKYMMLVSLACSVTGTIRSEDIMVDNEHGLPGYRESGKWSTGDHAGFTGRTYRFAEPRGNLSTATYIADLPTSGVYHVYAGFLASFNRSTDAYYTVNHADGNKVVRLNQQSPKPQFKTLLLGSFRFSGGERGSVQISNLGSGATIADMIIFRPATDSPAGQPPPAELFLQLENFPKRRLKVEED